MSATTKTKKVLSLLLAIIMLFTMMPTTIFSLGANESAPIMMQFTAASSGDFHKYYKQVYSVTFLDEIDTVAMDNALESWNISASADTGTVMAWMYLNEEATATAGANRYDVYIAGEGGVGANPVSSYIFYMFESLKEINNPENFKTETATTFYDTFYGCFSLEEVDFSSWDVSNVTTLKYMFYRCYGLRYANLSGWDTGNVTSLYGMFDMTPPSTNGDYKYSLEEVDLTGWDTSNVTTMENMFKNCESLKTLDLSSFNTSKVTTMRFMFYYCKNLKYVYIGSGWSTESVANLYDGVFNCCYAIVGGTDNQEENIKIYNDKHPSAYYPPAVEYAKRREDGGYLTDISQKPVEKKYSVTYEYIGEVRPENEPEVPVKAEYEEGVPVTVATAPTVDGYIFSGWKPVNVTAVDGVFTMPAEDVVIQGSWKKLYKVEYKYTDGITIPQGAPEKELLGYLGSTHTAGEDVGVVGMMPGVEGYIFVGWYTDDVEVAGDTFFMPENDVTFYGYYKKPVESVEFVHTGDVFEIDMGNIDEDNPPKIPVYVKPEDATIKDLVYESKDESIVKVNEKGEIEVVGEGTAKITVKSADDPTKGDEITVVVKTFVTEVTVDKTDITLYKGETDKVTGTVNGDATNKEVGYESENPEIATVDENGNITAKGKGTTTITVYSKDDPSIKETVTVTVKNPVTDITVTDEITIVVGETKNLEAKVNEDATEKGLNYDVEDPSVVKVDSNGDIIAVGEGTTTITITSKDDPSITKTVTVTAKKYKVTYAFVGDEIPKNVFAPESAKYGSGADVTVEGNPTAEGYTFSGWSTRDNADIKDGKFNIYNDVHFVGEWSRNKYNVKYEYINKVPEKAPSVPTESGYEYGKDVTVEAVPGLDGYTFSGWKPVNVTAVDGVFTMPAEDVVIQGFWTKKTAEDIAVDKNNVELEVGDTDKIIIEVKPDDVIDKDVIITSSDETVVKVDNEGNITAVGDGTAIITVASKDDPAIKEEITVTVIRKYNVTYKYTGEVPAGAPAVPSGATYVAGTEVDVKAEPTLEGYTFSGWSTDDATVADGKFILNSNVEFVGSWTKIPEYKVTYKYEGVVPVGAPSVPGEKTYKADVVVDVNDAPTFEGYTFSGWSTKDTALADGKFTMPAKDVVLVGSWTKLAPGPVTSITAPDKITVVLGEEVNIGATVNSNAANKKLNYVSDNEAVARVEADGTIITNGEGKAYITIISVDNPSVYKIIEVTVTAKPEAVGKHYMVFGKTEKIGWYTVSFDGGETWQTVFGNSNHVVDKGSEVIIKANDVFGDPFTFYINGQAVTPDENGYVRVVVDQYVLVGALGIPVIAPDAEEGLSWIQQIIQAIKDFFAKIKSWFTK